MTYRIKLFSAMYIKYIIYHLLNKAQMQKYKLKNNQLSTQSNWFIQFFKAFSSFQFCFGKTLSQYQLVHD